MSHITIHGVDYPTLDDDLDLDESCWFYEIAGVGPEVLGDLSERGFLPKVTKAMLCLMVARKTPETPQREIEQMIGKLKLTELQAVFESMGEQSPPSGSQSGSGGESETSGESLSSDLEASPAGEDPLSSGSPVSASSESDQTPSEGLRRVS